MPMLTLELWFQLGRNWLIKTKSIIDTFVVQYD